MTSKAMALFLAVLLGAACASPAPAPEPALEPVDPADAVRLAYLEATDDEVRAARLTELAAFRRRRDVPLLGAGLDAESLDVRCAATFAINDLWMEFMTGGGLESQMLAAGEWWNEHRAEFETSAD